MPVIGVKGHTYEVCKQIATARPICLPSSTAKIDASQRLMEEHIDEARLAGAHTVCPDLHRGHCPVPTDSSALCAL